MWIVDQLVREGSLRSAVAESGVLHYWLTPTGRKHLDELDHETTALPRLEFGAGVVLRARTLESSYNVTNGSFAFTAADGVLTLVAENDGKLGWYRLEQDIHGYDVPAPFLKPTADELIAAGLMSAVLDGETGRERYWITDAGRQRYDELQARGGVPRR